MPLHFLVLVSLVQSNPSRLSSCKRLLINLVAHDFIMKLMVLLIRALFPLSSSISLYIERCEPFFAFFCLIQGIIHDHSLLHGVAYVIPCNITLQYIDMAYRLVENMLYYTHDYTRTSIHTYNILQTCIRMHSNIQASTNPSPTSIRPYTHTTTYPGRHVRTYLSTPAQMYIQMYMPTDIRTYLGTGPDRPYRSLK